MASYLDDPIALLGMGLLGGTSPNFGQNAMQAMMFQQQMLGQQNRQRLADMQEESMALDLKRRKQADADDERMRSLQPPANENLYQDAVQKYQYYRSQGIPEAMLKPYIDRIEKLKPKYHVVDKGLVPEPAIPGAQVQPVYQAAQDQWEDLPRDPITGQQIQRNTRTNKLDAVGMKPTQVSQTVAGDKAFTVELAKLDAKQLDEMRDSAIKAQGGLSRLGEMKRLSQEGVYSGWAAEGRAGVANLFQTLGAPMDPKKLQNSQEYLKHAKELTLSMLKEGVGSTNISNADLAFVNQTVPQLETNPQARMNLLNYMEQRLGQSVQRFREADSYARQNSGLGGFDYTPKSSPQKPKLQRNETALMKAREAIKAGKDPAAVRQRLMEQGYDPEGL